MGDSSKVHSIFTTGKVTGSVTSTALDPHRENSCRSLTVEEIRNLYYLIVKNQHKKGLVQIITNYGSLNFELHCDIVPRTCENFLELAEKKYFDNTIFHRLVPHFVVSLLLFKLSCFPDSRRRSYWNRDRRRINIWSIF